jgi:hypothetical protein
VRDIVERWLKKAALVLVVLAFLSVALPIAVKSIVPALPILLAVGVAVWLLARLLKL